MYVALIKETVFMLFFVPRKYVSRQDLCPRQRIVLALQAYRHWRIPSAALNFPQESQNAPSLVFAGDSIVKTVV
jgi:hypothetical protein